MNNIDGQTILVIGGTGSIGTEIVKQLMSLKPAKVIVYARDESKHQHLFDSLGKPKNFRSVIGDVRDRERLRSIMPGIDIVINAAALKSVPYCEENPYEAVKTNLEGTQNIIEVALENNIKRVVGISTDKAAEPTSAYGTSKLLSEKLFVAAEYNKGNKKTIFSAIRLGNVLGARNSVLPVIRNQILCSNSITIADINMTRFVMTANEAVQIIINAIGFAEGGEIFMSKMHAVYIWDLIDVYVEKVCEKHGIDMNKIRRINIPARSGEKPFEKLFSEYEKEFVYEFNNVFAILPNQNIIYKPLSKRCYGDAVKIKSQNEYDSSLVDKLSKKEISTLLSTENLID